MRQRWCYTSVNASTIALIVAQVANYEIGYNFCTINTAYLASQVVSRWCNLLRWSCMHECGFQNGDMPLWNREARFSVDVTSDSINTASRQRHKDWVCVWVNHGARIRLIRNHRGRCCGALYVVALNSKKGRSQEYQVWMVGNLSQEAGVSPPNCWSEAKHWGLKGELSIQIPWKEDKAVEAKWHIQISKCERHGKS